MHTADIIWMVFVLTASEATFIRPIFPQQSFRTGFFFGQQNHAAVPTVPRIQSFFQSANPVGMMPIIVGSRAELDHVVQTHPSLRHNAVYPENNPIVDQLRRFFPLGGLQFNAHHGGALTSDFGMPRLGQPVAFSSSSTGYQPQTSYAPQTGYAKPDVEYEKPEPGYGAPKKGYEKPAAEYEKPEPTYGTPKKSYETPEPTYDAPKKSYEKPEPTYDAPKKSYEKPEPTYDAPKQTYEKPEPTYDAPKQTYEKPEPTYDAPKQTYEKPEPTYDAPKQTYEKPEPAYDAPRNSYEKPETGYSKPEPVSYQKAEPVYGQPQAYEKPTMSYQKPAAYPIPSVGYQNPAGSGEVPPVPEASGVRRPNSKNNWAAEQNEEETDSRPGNSRRPTNWAAEQNEDDGGNRPSGSKRPWVTEQNHDVEPITTSTTQAPFHDDGFTTQELPSAIATGSPDQTGGISFDSTSSFSSSSSSSSSSSFSSSSSSSSEQSQTSSFTGVLTDPSQARPEEASADFSSNQLQESGQNETPQFNSVLQQVDVSQSLPQNPSTTNNEFFAAPVPPQQTDSSLTDVVVRPASRGPVTSEIVRSEPNSQDETTVPPAPRVMSLDSNGPSQHADQLLSETEVIHTPQIMQSIGEMTQPILGETQMSSLEQQQTNQQQTSNDQQSSAQSGSSEISVAAAPTQVTDAATLSESTSNFQPEQTDAIVLRPAGRAPHPLLRRRRGMSETELMDHEQADHGEHEQRELQADHGDHDATDEEKMEKGDMQDSDMSPETPIILSEEDIEQYFSFIRERDAEQCVARLICEIPQNVEKYGQSGKQIQEFFREYNIGESLSATKFYKDAATLGEMARTDCASEFPKCELSSEEMMNITQMSMAEN